MPKMPVCRVGGTKTVQTSCGSELNATSPKEQTRAAYREFVHMRDEFSGLGRIRVGPTSKELGKLPSAASPGARLFFRGSPRPCQSSDTVSSKPYSLGVGCPAFIDSSDLSIIVWFLRQKTSFSARRRTSALLERMFAHG